MKRIFLALAAIILAAPAYAQTSGTVTNHAFAIGKGPGQTGYTSLLCAATELAIGQSAANPICHALSGDVTMDAGGVTAIGTAKVTYAMIQNVAGLSVVGRSANSSGVSAAITAANDGEVLRRSGTALGFGTIATAGITDDAVTNAKLANMANGTTKCRTTALTGDPEDCTASQMRTLLSLVPGTNVQVWDADLDCIAAISSSGIITRTGAGTCASRQVVAPAAGITVTNPAGTAGDITLALANDLAALEGVSGTGIARRTGTDAWSVGTLVTNGELANVSTATFKGRTTGGSGSPEDLTATQATALLNGCMGDSGSGGTKGLVTAPGAGDAAAAKFLKADCTWAVPAGGSGGSGMSDTERQNSLLDRGYASKFLGDARRVVNSWATGFKAATDTLRGILAGSSSNYDTTFAASGGYVLPTISSTDALASQTLNADSSGWSGYTFRQWINASAISGTGSNIRLTLSPPSTGTSMVVAAMYVGHAAGAGDAYDFDGNQVAVTVGGSGGFTLTAGGADVTTDVISFAYDETKPIVVSWVITAGDVRRNVAIGGGTMVTYYRAATSEAGTTNATTGYSTSATATALTAVKRIEVGVAFANMTLVTTLQTSDTSVSNGRVLLEYADTATPALNTDLTAEVTCNGGSNWASASLSSVTSKSQGGLKVAESVDQACTSGTSFGARIKTLNNKSVPIYVATVTVH